MESVEFSGIVFRSTSHMLWFILTVSIFIILVVVILILLKFKRHNKGFLLLSVYAFILSGGLHLTGFIIALIKTKGGAINGPRTSVDCIWYNGVMLFVILIFFLLSFRQYRKGKD